MKTVEVEIKGISPLLHNRFPAEEFGENASTKKKKVYVPKDEADKKLYKNLDGSYYQPAEHIFQSLVKAGVDFKFEGRKIFKDIINSGIAITPENIPLDCPFVIDERSVVIQRARVLAWRPRFDEWSVKFKIEIIDDDNIPVSTLNEILAHAGMRKGIGDYRPRYGRYMVTKFKELG